MDVKETLRTSLAIFICLFCVRFVHASQPVILGMIPAGNGVSTGPLGDIHIDSSIKSKVRLLGVGLVNGSEVLFTPAKGGCTGGKTTKAFPVNVSDQNIAIVEIELEKLEVGIDVLYVCLKTNQTKWEHQSTHPWLSIQVNEPEGGPLMPLWLQISICAVLLVLSGLFSGLNLGLMSLDQTELAIIQKVGSPMEKKHAKRISPLRKRGNFLLCTLLLGNVMVNSTFTILFDNLTNGLIAIISSTIGIVIFGEIIPQAICSRHGLAVGAKTYWITRFFMVITFPLSFSISLILDKILGEEMGQVFNKEKLQELIRMTADQRVLHDNEANIMAGALQLTNKSVEDVMTNIEDVFMLEINTELDFDTLTEIMRHGFTRVPVYEKEITNIINLLNTKDLALIDPDDKTQLRTVCRYYDHKPLYVDYDLKLDAMLQEFLQGNCHMAIVQRLHNTENKDPYFENIGVITLEDVIEEILQSEIIDETDRMTDNRQKKPLGKQSNYGLYPSEPEKSKLPRQLEFVAFQFLSSNVEPFTENYMHRNVLKNLMKKDIVVNLNPTTPDSDHNYLFKKGQPSDKFVLILQGSVEVTIGTENLKFESGPFSFYGTECISNTMRLSTQDLKRIKEYIPDYSVRAMTAVQYLCIRRYHYLAALRTTRMLRSQWQSMDDKNVDDHFDMELAKFENKNGSNSRMTEVHAPPNLPLEALKNDESPKKKSTSSLDRIMSLTRKHDSLTRMKRSGSDVKDRPPDYSPELGSTERTKKNSESSSVDNFEDPASDKGTPKNTNPAALKSQTSFPFTPHAQVEGPVSNSPGSAIVWPEEDATACAFNTSSPGNGGSSHKARTGRGDSGDDKADVNAGDDTLEKVPLVEIKRSPQTTGNENPGLARKFEPYADSESVPLMQQSERTENLSKDSSSSHS